LWRRTCSIDGSQRVTSCKRESGATKKQVSGILPVVGVPLPFLSYGGTAMVTMGIGLGMLMSIAKSKRLMQT